MSAIYDGFATIVLEARDLERSAEFYQRVLGFTFDGWWNAERSRLSDAPPDSPGPSFVELSAGPTRVRLRPASRGAATGSEILLRVRDLDLLYRRVEETGAGATRPKSGFDGRRRFSVIDPDGHRWSLVQA